MRGTILKLFLLLLAFDWNPRLPVDAQYMNEICDNAIDDDADGLVDLNDPDCQCEVDGPVSLIPNPSFEAFDCCPMMRSELNCATTWIQASSPTTDFIHECGYMGWPNLLPPLPFPDGDGIVGFRNGRFIGGQTPSWKEYAGACLTEPLEAGREYIIQFNVGFTNPINSPPTTIGFFGTSDCINLPFGVENVEIGCPSNDINWSSLGQVDVATDFGWLSSEIRIRPEVEIAAVAIGPSCEDITSDVDVYYFLDNLLLDEPEPFNYQITYSGHPCQDDFMLHLPENEGFTYQWYKNGVAIPGADSASLLIKTDEGLYQARVDNGEACKLTNTYDHRIPVYQTRELREICPGETIFFNGQELSESGIYFDTLLNVTGCDSIVRLQLRILSEDIDTLSAKVFSGETYEYNLQTFSENGEYLLSEPTDKGCERLILLQLSYYQIFIPNAFSPNNDGINDRFVIRGGADLERIVEMQIFDRWGNLVFSNKFFNPNDPFEGWNGRYKGQFVPPGIYVYSLIVKMSDGQDRSMAGDVLLIYN